MYSSMLSGVMSGGSHACQKHDEAFETALLCSFSLLRPALL